MTEKDTPVVRPFDPIGDLLRSSSPLQGWLGRLDETRSRAMPTVDISEDDDQYVVTAELPGAKKDDLTVELHDNVLTIRGEKKSEREEKNENRCYVERTYGSFSRSFSLPANADPDRVNASIEDGVLTVEIGKREESKPKTIAVK